MIAAWLSGLAAVALAVSLALAGMLLVRRSVPLPVLQEHNEVAGFIFAVVGVVYAVLLALVVVAVWERYEAAEARVEQEANDLGDLFRDAQAFAAPIGDQLRGQIRGYVQLVIEEEWPAMAAGEASPRAWNAFDRLWQAYLQVEPRTAYESSWYNESLERLNTLGDHRQLRLLRSRSGLPGVMWMVLLTGGVITVAFSYLFGTERALSHALMVAALAATLALILFLISALEYPFVGASRLEPQAFEQLLEIFDHRMQPDG